MIKLAALELPLARLLKTKMEERENLLLGNKLVLAGKALIFYPLSVLLRWHVICLHLSQQSTLHIFPFVVKSVLKHKYCNSK